MQINYEDKNVEIVRAPGAAEAATFTIVQNDHGRLVGFKLPLAGNPSWTVAYEDIGEITCLSKLQSPAGLVEEVEHKQEGHKLPEGGPYKTIPVVKTHTLKPGNQQPAIRTTYDYSEKNFFGYRDIKRWKRGEDNLYHVKDDYHYKATVSVEGGQTITYTYDKFHLMVEMHQKQNGKQITQSVTYHTKNDVPFAAQCPQFQLPKSVQTTCHTAARGPTRDEWTHHDFDE